MLLGGIWHGAGINFVIWGALHGLFIFVNHLWRDYVVAMIPALARSKVMFVPAYVLTMSCVLLGWLFFRSETTMGALALTERMFWPPSMSLAGGLPITQQEFSLILCAVFIAVAMPNSRQIHDWLFAIEVHRRWMVGMAAGALFAAAFVSLSAESPFLYFQF
jgi:alginate O-acetyltransferase complex protein AlgI